VIGIIVVTMAPAAGQDCKSPSAALKQAVTSYVQKRYGTPGATDFRVTEITLVGSACYRRITLETASGNRKITLYLTPDEKYLTTNLMDLSEDPSQAFREVERDTMNALLAGSPPSRGPVDAPVTIVEFADYECPSCRRFAEVLAQLPESEAPKLRVVFRRHPFSFHAWARRAAAASICADAQDHGAFRKLSDFLFAHQDDLTAENFDARVLPFVSDELHLNPAAIKSCHEKGEYEKALSEDERLAAQYEVRKTPTFFVNGRRFVGFRSAGDLRRAIDAALATTHNPPAGSPNHATP
jgi:protein-disulfide isomerase